MGPRRRPRASNTRNTIRLQAIQERVEEVVSLFEELGAETSESGAGAKTSGSGAGVEKFLKQFCKVAPEKGVVLYKVMALNLEQKEFNIEQTSIYVKLHESMLRSSVTSPELQSSYLEMVVELENNVPTAADWSLPPGQVVDLLQKAFPFWEMTKLVSVVGVMMSICKSSTSTRSSSSFSSFLSFAERGVHALKSRVEVNLPEPLDDVTTEQIWPSKFWITDESPGKSMKRMLKLLHQQEPTKINCTFELQDKSTCESVTGKGSKPDMLLVLKGLRADVYSTGAIICLHSKGGGSRFDNSDSVGEAIQYGLKFLKRAGAVREFICVGITDLEDIMWFRVSRDLDGLDKSEYLTQMPTTGKVKQSFCAYLVAKPASLGLEVTPMELGLPKNWQWKRILGCGRTSIVHEIEVQGGRYALKVPSGEASLAGDFVYLSVLEAVDGIPVVYAQVGEMLVLRPVGHPFSLSSLQKFQLKKSLPQLVEILKAAHDLGYVNRDIRVENFMIAQSLHEQKTRLFILDWGFAAKCGAECQFAGCLYTSSNDVLSQLLNEEKVTYRGADDLVGVIRCMRMLVDNNTANSVMSIISQTKGKVRVEAVMNCWKLCMAADPKWQEVECKAQNGDYDGVKDFLRMLGSFVVS